MNEPAPHDRTLQEFRRLRKYRRDGRAPWTRTDDRIGFLTIGEADTPLDRTVSRAAFSEMLRERFAGDLKKEAIDGLAIRAPEDSARDIGRKVDATQVLLATAVFGGGFLVAPETATAYGVLAASLLFVAVATLRVGLAVIAARLRSAAPRRALSPDDLPVVTILVPLYREAHALPGLIQALGRLDYPDEKLDIKLLLEEDDGETLREALRLGLPSAFDLIIVPTSSPRTKPKACNYGLACAAGDLVVIYDAEDAPQENQLRLAAETFAAGDETLACVQAKLNFYNPDETWLTRLFALEYCLWFDHLLPALDRLGAPLPLGGTSNVFRTELLAEAGGWDPHNVTEDADLGLRLSRRGLRTAVIDSTTYEEANCRTGNWMRQRSRWMKGFMQTWLVHRRRCHDRRWRRNWRTVISVDLFVGGAAAAALLNPLLLAVLAAEALTGQSPIATLPEPLRLFNFSALVAGNLAFLGLAAFAPFKRRLGRLAPAALLTPVYWLMMSAAAWRALFQLLTRPSFWEKTDHGLSEEAQARRAAALQELGLEPDAASRHFGGEDRAAERPARREATPK